MFEKPIILTNLNTVELETPARFAMLLAELKASTSGQSKHNLATSSTRAGKSSSRLAIWSLRLRKVESGAMAVSSAGMAPHQPSEYVGKANGLSGCQGACRRLRDSERFDAVIKRNWQR